MSKGPRVQACSQDAYYICHYGPVQPPQGQNCSLNIQEWESVSQVYFYACQNSKWREITRVVRTVAPLKFIQSRCTPQSRSPVASRYIRPSGVRIDLAYREPRRIFRVGKPWAGMKEQCVAVQSISDMASATSLPGMDGALAYATVHSALSRTRYLCQCLATVISVWFGFNRAPVPI